MRERVEIVCALDQYNAVLCASLTRFHSFVRVTLLTLLWLDGSLKASSPTSLPGKGLNQLFYVDCREYRCAFEIHKSCVKYFVCTLYTHGRIYIILAILTIRKRVHAQNV